MAFSDYLVFVDESGDHSLESINPDYPVFVLAFCIVARDCYIDQITPEIRRLKCGLFGHDMVVLHEHEMRKKTGPFSKLNKEARERLIQGLTDLIARMPLTIIAVVIDKVRHKQRYVTPEHPYHLAMQYGLERVHDFLRMNGQMDRTTHVVFEARGAREDAELELQFRRVCDGSNRNNCQYPLEIVIANKQVNSEGLQLADLVARPIGLHVLRPGQVNRAWNILEQKLFMGVRGITHIGNGLKVFPDAPTPAGPKKQKGPREVPGA